MEKSNKRGKIPQSDWPLIMARYDAGETLASIARTYDCSPPAISYVVSRSRARHPSVESPAATPSIPEPQPQLIKGMASEPPAAGPGGLSPPGGPAAPAPLAANGIAGSRGDGLDRFGEASPAGPDTAAASPRANSRAHPDYARDHYPPREVNGSARGGFAERGAQSPNAPANGTPTNGSPTNGARFAATEQRPPAPLPANSADQRRKLHLSLRNTVPANGSSRQPELASGGRPGAASHDSPAQTGPAGADPGHGGAGRTGLSEAGSVFEEPARKNGNDIPAGKRGSAAFIDHELRTRVDGDIAAFLAAFDAALVQDTQESRSALREATDRLLRAGARTRIELERLEARLPLPARGSLASNDPAAWRYR